MMLTDVELSYISTIEPENSNNRREVKRIVCKTCLKSFTNLSNYKYHTAHHGTERPWLCDECPKTYKTKIDLNFHIKSHSDQPAKPPPKMRQQKKCEKCDKIVANLVLHNKLVHDKVRDHVCSMCLKGFGKKSGLVRHVLTVHEKRQDWPCDLCGKACAEKSQLLKHRKIHFKLFDDTKLVDEPDPEQVSDDEEIVEGDKRKMKCGACKKVVTTKASLARHKLLVHKKQKSFLCDFCSKTFGEASNLKQHMRNRHKAEIETERSEETEGFSCSLCCKNLTSKWRLEAHEETCRIRYQKKLNSKLDNCEMSLEEETIEEVLLTSQAEILPVKQEIESMEDEPKASQVLAPIETLIKQEFERILDEDHVKVENDSEIVADFLSSDFKTSVKFSATSNEENKIKKINLKTNSSSVYEVFNPTKKTVSDKETQCDIIAELASLEAQLSVTRPEIIFLSCDLCGETFFSRSSLNNHMSFLHIKKNLDELYGCLSKDDEKRNQTPVLTCKLCKPNKTFKWKTSFTAHTRNFHPKVAFECPDCKENFITKSFLNRHIKKYHSKDKKVPKVNRAGPFVCIACGKILASYSSLYHHENYVHGKSLINWLKMEVTKGESSAENKFGCDLCGRFYKNRMEILRHIRNVHKNKPLKSYSRTDGVNCKLCKENFAKTHLKKKHWIQVHHQGKITVRTCHACNSSFQLFSHFKAHVESHVGFFICMICGHQKTDASALLIHQESHLRIEEHLRMFICDVCSDRTVSMSQLRIHMRKHSTQNHYVCEVCGKSYKFIAPFVQHKLGHENKFDFPCQFCDKRFKIARERTLHERVHTKERPYKCEQCGRAFNVKSSLKLHKKTHEVRSHICKLCGLQLPSATGLERHEHVEHPELRPHVCNYCQKPFKVDYALAAHKLKCEWIEDCGEENLDSL